MFRYAACCVVLLAGCSDKKRVSQSPSLECEESRMDVPFVMFHRYPNYPVPNQESICGPIVAVWPDGRIVRVASEDVIGKAYVEGTLASAQLRELLRFIETNEGLLDLDGGEVIVDAAWERLGIRLKGHRLEYGETVGDYASLRHNPEMAALRQHLMSLVIREPRPAESP